MSTHRPSSILVTCPKGIPPILAAEIRSLGLPVHSEQVSGVETEGTIETAMKLNLQIRTGHRVLYVLHRFVAGDPDGLYRHVVAYPWEELLPADGYVCVTSSVNHPCIRDHRFASLRCKDAIVDRIKARCGRRPDSGPERERSVVHLYWEGERCVLYLDTSGVPLSRRGYRRIPLAAPMQETLAAAVVLATGWDGRGTMVNPMCGSGTLAIEAALIGLGRAPGLMRDNFGFMHVRDFSSTVWSSLREQAANNSRKDVAGRIIASDIREEAMLAARDNALSAGVDDCIDFRVGHFFDQIPPSAPGIIVMNPEYGERMGDSSELAETYRMIGDYFKQRCQGFTGYVFTGNPALGKQIGLKPDRTWTFYNGGIKCALLEFAIYQGSKKQGKRDSRIVPEKESLSSPK